MDKTASGHAYGKGQGRRAQRKPASRRLQSHSFNSFTSMDNCRPLSRHGTPPPKTCHSKLKEMKTFGQQKQTKEFFAM
ncbi:hypothetical protein [Dyella jiangningensis]